MEFVAFAILALVAVVLCALILHKVWRPAPISEELGIRIAELEQIASALPNAFREKSQIGREELRSAVGSRTMTVGTWDDCSRSDCRRFQLAKLPIRRKFGQLIEKTKGSLDPLPRFRSSRV